MSHSRSAPKQWAATVPRVGRSASTGAASRAHLVTQPVTAPVPERSASHGGGRFYGAGLRHAADPALQVAQQRRGLC